MVVARSDGHAITRNSLFFKKFSENALNNSYSSDYEEQKNEINERESNITLRHSTRIRNMPKPYEDYENEKEIEVRGEM